MPQLSEIFYTSQENINWHLDSIVDGLKDVRQQWRDKYLQSDYHNKRLFPSKENVSSIVDTLSKILYPMRLGATDLKKESEDYYVGYLLGNVLDRLAEEALLEQRYNVGESSHLDNTQTGDQRVIDRIKRFAAQLPEIRKLLDSDILAAYQGDPSARSIDEVLLCYPGIHAVIHYRLAHVLYQLDFPLLARIITEKAHSQTGIDIHPGAQIDEGFFIDHGTGVVIGETAIIGKRVRIYQAVTLGAKNFITDSNGNLKKRYPRHPIIENDVVIYAGATLLGRITIGARSSIGGNVWLTRDTPPDSNIRQANLLQSQYKDGDGI
ncbi:serine O-acetyltransferase EpsC [Pectobacterium versatile]|uniref:serine O-acetyltransferase EpsC n=1 Tax=Pectobacterium versatile TaxID=2488639 RepID=UPI0030199420